MTSNTDTLFFLVCVLVLLRRSCVVAENLDGKIRKKWDDLANYDMVLDSSAIGIDGCVNAIAASLA